MGHRRLLHGARSQSLSHPWPGPSIRPCKAHFSSLASSSLLMLAMLSSMYVVLEVLSSFLAFGIFESFAASCWYNGWWGEGRFGRIYKTGLSLIWMLALSRNILVSVRGVSRVTGSSWSRFSMCCSMSIFCIFLLQSLGQIAEPEDIQIGCQSCPAMVPYTALDHLLAEQSDHFFECCRVSIGAVVVASLQVMGSSRLLCFRLVRSDCSIIRVADGLVSIILESGSFVVSLARFSSSNCRFASTLFLRSSAHFRCLVSGVGL